MFHKEGSSRKKGVMDVPLRNSTRKQLRQRVAEFFKGRSSSLNKLLNDVFLEGQISARTIHMDHKTWNMILYIKSPTHTDASTTWPYTKTAQFVWMALEEKSEVVQE